MFLLSEVPLYRPDGAHVVQTCMEDIVRGIKEPHFQKAHLDDAAGVLARVCQALPHLLASQIDDARKHAMVPSSVFGPRVE